MDNYKVYVLVNDDGFIISVCSSAFLHDITGWKEIASGNGDKYHHAQANYFPLPIITDGGAWRYKLVDGVPVECTAEEIAEQEEALKPVPVPDPQDDMDAMLIDHELRLTMLELGIN